MRGYKFQDKTGVILIVVLWILVILTTLAIGLGRRASVDLTLSKYGLGKLKSKYLSMAGVFYAMEKIHEDSHDEETVNFDTKFQCGFRLEENETPEGLFKEIEVGEGTFDIFYTDSDDPQTLYYGFIDEERKINLNTLNFDNYNILGHLLMELGYNEDTAETIASSVIDWIDENNEVFNASHGAEEDYYLSLETPFYCKNRSFDSLEELMLVRGMTKEIFREIKEYITIFPKSGKFLVNIDTAPEPVLLAVTRNLSGARTNTALEDADSLVEKILSYRRGNDGLDGTGDDQIVNMNEMGLNVKEKVILLLFTQNRTKVSKYFYARVKGVDKLSSITSFIDAIIFREDLSLVYWHRN